MIAVFMAVPLYLLSVWITDRVRRMAIHNSILALPDARSAHQMPTPVGGGLAIVAVYILVLAALWLGELLPGREALLMCAVLPVAWSGWMDDRRPLDFKFRLGTQIAAVVWVLMWVPVLPFLALGPLQIPSVVLTWVLLPLALLWLTNLYNFMDGIDGIAGSQACFVACAAGLWLLHKGDIGLAMLCLALFAACTGFLVWNWAPAQIFMGDVGSAFLGFTLGVIALLGHVHGSMSLWSWMLLMGVFVVDATLTLGKRLFHGERWYQAHSSHAFQHAARRCGHTRVTLAALAINVVWLAPLALLAGAYPEYGIYLTLVGLLPLALLANRLGAGRAGSTAPSQS